MLTITERIRNPGEMYRLFMEKTSTNLRVACPGIVQSFDASAQTVTVQLAIREKVNIDGNLEWTEIPVLVDVPMFFPRAGGYVLTMPVAAGDECLVVFGDMCIDAWWQNGGVQNQVDKRRHDLSDGFALIGVWSQPRRVASYSGNSAQLRNEAGSAYIEIAGSKVNVVADEFTVSANKYSVTATQSTINGNGTTTIDGKQFLTHVHSGVQPGGGNTGGVA